MIEEVKNAVLKGKRKTIESIICTALDNGASASEILASMTAAMDEIGIGFQNNEIYVPEMLVAATTMQKGVDVVRPLLAAGEIGGLGKVVVEGFLRGLPESRIVGGLTGHNNEQKGDER